MAYFIRFLLTAINFYSMDIICFSLIRVTFLLSLIIILMCFFLYSNIFLFTLYSKPIPLYPFFFDLSSLIFYLQSPSYFSFLPQPLPSTSSSSFYLSSLASQTFSSILPSFLSRTFPLSFPSFMNLFPFNSLPFIFSLSNFFLF